MSEDSQTILDLMIQLFSQPGELTLDETAKYGMVLLFEHLKTMNDTTGEETQ